MEGSSSLTERRKTRETAPQNRYQWRLMGGKTQSFKLQFGVFFFPHESKNINLQGIEDVRSLKSAVTTKHLKLDPSAILQH